MTEFVGPSGSIVGRGWDHRSRRWWWLFPWRRNEDGSPAEPAKVELNAIRNDIPGLTLKRRRLKDISWFMRCLTQPIARRGNKDDNASGRFWTDRQLRNDKIVRIPDECAPILERLECSAETWLDFGKNSRKRFRDNAGLAQNRQHAR